MRTYTCMYVYTQVHGSCTTHPHLWRVTGCEICIGWAWFSAIWTGQGCPLTACDQQQLFARIAGLLFTFTSLNERNNNNVSPSSRPSHNREREMSSCWGERAPTAHKNTNRSQEKYFPLLKTAINNQCFTWIAARHVTVFRNKTHFTSQHKI